MHEAGPKRQRSWRGMVDIGFCKAKESVVIFMAHAIPTEWWNRDPETCSGNKWFTWLDW